MNGSRSKQAEDYPLLCPLLENPPVGEVQGEVHLSVLAGGRTFARKQCGNRDILGVVKLGFVLFIICCFNLYLHTLASLCCVSGAAVVTLGEVWYVLGPALPM